MGESTSTQFGPFTLEARDQIGVVTFERPPVNSFRVSTYQELEQLAEHIDSREDVSVVILKSGEESRCWCGGADVNDFSGMDGDSRKDRYEYVNAAMVRFANIQRPVIAAIDGHAIGIGVLLAAVCDIRVAADTAQFATPEINYGLIAGSSRLLNYVGIPEGLVRELAFTGRRASAAELKDAGFLNHVVSKASVNDKALEIASEIASKALNALKTRKRIFTEHEKLGWFEAYQLAQKASSTLVGTAEAQQGVKDFLKGKPASK